MVEYSSLRPLAQSAEFKAEVEKQLERRLSLRPTRTELEQRNIIKGMHTPTPQ
jgi:hypothetical protein